MPDEQRQDSQAPAPRRQQPRDAARLRSALGAEATYGMRRLPPVASNDGNSAGGQGAQAVAGALPPLPSNDGNSARPMPAVRPRVVPPADPGRVAPPPVRSRFPRPAAAVPVPASQPPQATSALRTDAEAPQAPAAEALRGRVAPAVLSDDAESYFTEDNDFRRPGGGDEDDETPSAERSGPEGDFAEPDGYTFEEPIPEPPPRPAPVFASARPVAAIEDPDRLARAARSPTEPPVDGPVGPDFERLRLVSQAMQQTTAERRLRLQQRRASGEDGNEAATADQQQRMSSLLQASNTHAEYLKRGRQLLKRYKRESRVHLADEDVDPLEFANWLTLLMPSRKPSTRRQYRLAVGAVIQTIPHANLEEAMAVLAGATRLHDEDEDKAVDRRTLEKSGGATSAARAKRMELAHFRKLRSSLGQMSRANAVDWLDDWLVAGINTGLRPGEWPLAHLERRTDPRNGARRVWLHVVNAKQTNGRANGTYRTLDISSYRDETLEAIHRMVERSQRWALNGETRSRQKDCAQLFYALCNTLFPRMTIKYSLYSLRHQFIANMKSVFADDALVATLIGHISVETQVEHYGKRRSAWGRYDIVDVPTPIEDQVQQVRKHLAALQEREQLRLLRKAFVEGRGAEGPDEFGYDPPDVEIELANDETDERTTQAASSEAPEQGGRS